MDYISEAKCDNIRNLVLAMISEDDIEHDPIELFLERNKAINSVAILRAYPGTHAPLRLRRG